jgi:AcrR family transcriptional regulator
MAEDRRKVRTRQLLRDALMALIVEKGYENIQVQDITERANVARATFYLHYGDKDELLFASLREIYEQLAQLQRPADMFLHDLQNPDDIDSSDFEHVAAHAEFYKVMLSDKGSIAFLWQVTDYLAGIFQTEIIEAVDDGSTLAAPRVPSDFLAHCLVGMQINAMRWWLKNGMQYSPKQMAQMLEYVCLLGAGWATGLHLPHPNWAAPTPDTAD